MPNIVKYVRRKNGPESYDSPINFGTKPCFVSPIRNSHLNNLEEQILLGTDDYMITKEDSDGNIIIEQNFCAANLEFNPETKNYYKMISTIYQDVEMYSDVAFHGDALEFSDKLKDAVKFGDGIAPYDDETTVYFINTDSENKKFDWGEDGININDPLGGYAKTREDQLYFVKDDSDNPLHVLTKITGVKNIGGMQVTYSNIVNYLKPSE